MPPFLIFLFFVIPAQAGIGTTNRAQCAPNNYFFQNFLDPITAYAVMTIFFQKIVKNTQINICLFAVIAVVGKFVFACGIRVCDVAGGIACGYICVFLIVVVKVWGAV